MKNALLFAAMFSACPPAAAAVTRDTPQAAFARYQDTINRHEFGLLEKDVIASDALFIFNSETHRGLADVRQAFEKSWATLPDEIYTMSKAQWLSLDRDSAVVRFRYDYRGTTVTGVPLSGGGSGTNLYRRIPAGWRLAYEHLAHDPRPANAAKPSSQSPDGIRRDVLLEAPLSHEKLVAAFRSERIQLPPQARPGAHRHSVPVVGYVVEGEILYQQAGQPGRLLRAGDAFHEPADVEIERFDNVSPDRPAVFVATYLKGDHDLQLLFDASQRQGSPCC